MPKIGDIVDMGAMRRAADERRERIRRPQVLDALLDLGGASRDRLAHYFGAPATTIQTHLSKLSEEGAIYASEWVEPEGSGQWSPVWSVQTDPPTRSAQRPQSFRHTAPPPRSLEELEEQTVVRGQGVKQEHVRMAKALPVITVAGETVDVGIFGGLVRASGKPPRVSVSTGRPRGRPRATATAATR